MTYLPASIFGLLALMVACGTSAPAASPDGIPPLADSGSPVVSNVKGEAGGVRIDLQSVDAGRSDHWNGYENKWDISYQPSAVVMVENTDDAGRSLVSYEFRSVLGNTGESHSVIKAVMLNPSGERIDDVDPRDETILPGEVRRYRMDLGSYLTIEDLKLQVLWVGQPDPLLDTPLKNLFPAETWVTPPDLEPDFMFTLFQGEKELGSESLLFSQLPNRPIVLTFCGDIFCALEELQAFYEAYKTQVIVLEIDVGQQTGLGNIQDTQNLLRERSVSYPVGYTNDSTVITNFGVFSIPTTLFITSKGETFRHWSGPLNQTKLEEIVNEMLIAEESR